MFTTILVITFWQIEPNKLEEGIEVDAEVTEQSPFKHNEKVPVKAALILLQFLAVIGCEQV
jgi:hypothetical protein